MVETMQPSSFNSTTFDPAAFNPHAPDYIKNPYPYYEWFRQNAPVHWVGTPYNSHWVFRYRDVKQVLTGTDLWIKNDPVAKKPPPTFGVLANMPEGIFTSDNPRHDEVRNALNPLFAKAINGLEAAAASIAQPLLAAAGSRRRFELIEAFALPMPAQALCHVLGVPERDWPLIMKWVAAILLANDPTRGLPTLVTGGTTSMALRAYYHALIPGKPIAPATGKMVALMASEGEQSPAHITPDEVVANAVTMSIAGYYSTTFLIGTGTLNLLNAPSAMSQLRSAVANNDNKLLHSAIGEMLRYDGPVQLIDRYAAQDTEIEGVPIPKGGKVTVVTGSANHDEDVFADPAQFDISRNTEALLSFGDGIHRCLGEPMFWKVAPVAFRSLFGELPRFELGGQPQWQTDPYLRAVSNLPLSFATP